MDVVRVKAQRNAKFGSAEICGVAWAWALHRSFCFRFECREPKTQKHAQGPQNESVFT